MTYIQVPDQCISLLKEQRTCYTDPKNQYGIELHNTLAALVEILPDKATNILDIGCGMAGISVLLSQHYNHSTQIHLLDKHGVSDTINAGFNKNAQDFAHYHDFDLAKLLMSINGVPLDNVVTYDITTQSFPDVTFDVVISLLSWGFHYPIDTYSPKLSPGGVIIADVRDGTNGVQSLSKYGKTRIVHTSKKYKRIVVQC